MATLSYSTVGSNRLEEAKSFYDTFLGSIGFQKLFDHPSGGRVYGQGQAWFGVLGPYNGEPASVGNGTMAGFSCASRDEVDALHAKAVELGGSCEGAPGERGPGFYFAYFRDLDGNKLTAFHVS